MNLNRSTTAPVISAGVMMANIIWKTANSISSPGSMPDSPTSERSPTRALPSPNAMLYPHRTHTTLTTAMLMKLSMMVLMTLRLRTRPP